MNAAEFEATLKQDGFDEIETKSVHAHKDAQERHVHPFDVRALVLEGEITLTTAAGEETYRAGDVFTMASGCQHTEMVGEQGVRFLVGRRRSAEQRS